MLDKINSYDIQEGNNIVKDDEDSNKEDSNKIEEDNSENNNVELSKEDEEFAKKLLEDM